MPAAETVTALRAEIEVVFDLFDRWCARTPEELAVVPGDVGWSMSASSTAICC